MTQCNFMYASGLRIKEGDGVVVLDGKTLRVIRDGRGRSNMDLPLSEPPSDGTITLKDLRTALAERGESSIELQVRDKTWHTNYTPQDGRYLAFSVDIDPSAAMGRQGREGDFAGALLEMSRDEQVAASLYQLKTLPDSDKQAGSETSERLRLAVETVGGVAEALPHLDGRFGLLADQSLLDETLAYVTSENYKPGERGWLNYFPSTKRDEIGPTVLRIAGPAISDPSRVPDEYFKHVVEYECRRELDDSIKVEFVDNTFDRLDDDSLREILYRSMRWRRSRAEFAVLITDPDRLQRIMDWDPDKNLFAGAATIVYEEIAFGTAVHRQSSWLADKARQLSAQFRTPEE